MCSDPLHNYSWCNQCSKFLFRQEQILFLGNLNCTLNTRRDGSLDVTGERLTAEKVPYFWAFRASDRQRRGAKMAAKTLMWEHIKGNVRRVE